VVYRWLEHWCRSVCNQLTNKCMTSPQSVQPCETPKTSDYKVDRWRNILVECGQSETIWPMAALNLWPHFLLLQSTYINIVINAIEGRVMLLVDCRQQHRSQTGRVVALFLSSSFTVCRLQLRWEIMQLKIADQLLDADSLMIFNKLTSNWKQVYNSSILSNILLYCLLYVGVIVFSLSSCYCCLMVTFYKSW